MTRHLPPVSPACGHNNHPGCRGLAAGRPCPCPCHREVRS